MIRRPQISPLFPSTTLFQSIITRPAVNGSAVCMEFGLYHVLTARVVVYVVDSVGCGSARCSNDVNHNPSRDRKSTRLNSSHQIISYAVFCLKKKKPHAHDSN